jgi:adenylate kinase
MDPHDQPDRAAWIQGLPVKCTPGAPRLETPWRLILLGAPGVGKGTQAELLHRRLNACHLSTGDVFRAAAACCECDLSPAMKAALECMRRGDLVSDSIVWEMVLERSGCLHCGGGFLLDGFPRTLNQAESLKGLMENQGITVDAVINYELPLDEIARRLGGRRTCKQCKAVFHVTERPPKRPDVCDHCGGMLLLREDDRPESVKVRLEAYQAKTAPLIDFYRDLRMLLPVSASGSPEEICERTIAALRSRRQAYTQPAMHTKL